jgi:hypothetical protein
VDEDDYERVAGHRWVMQGDPDASSFVYRYRHRREREAHERQTLGLAQELLGQPGRITLRNGNRLDYRRANSSAPVSAKAGISAVLRSWPRHRSRGAAAQRVRPSSCR